MLVLVNMVTNNGGDGKGMGNGSDDDDDNCTNYPCTFV